MLDKDGTLENSPHFSQKLANERAILIESEIKQNIKESLLAAWGIQDNILDLAGLMAVGSREENATVAAACVAQKGYSWFKAKEIVERAFEQAHKNCTKTRESSPLFPGVSEMLESFTQAGLKLGIVSADSTPEIVAFTQRHQLSEYIKLSLGSDLSFRKPDPRLFIQACEMLQVSPSQTLMIGDSLGDIKMAQEAGAAGTIGISWSESLGGHLETADIEIRDIKEIQIFH